MKTLNLIPDTIIYNGYVHTVDENNSIAEAVAVKDEKIIAVGSNKEVMELAGDNTLIIDAAGNTVMPGVNDSHVHMWEAGMLMEGVVTFGLESIDALKKAIQEKLKGMKPGEWLQGGGWIESQFVEKRMPTKYDIDDVSPDNPVVIERIFSTCVANSRALELAGITKDTPDPEGGEIGRNPDGTPNGLLFRTAKQLVRDVMPSAFGESQFGSGKEIERVIVNAMNEFLKAGITSITEPGVTPAMIRAYQNLRETGKLKIRTNLMPCWHGFAINEKQDFSDRLIGELGLYTGFGDEWLRIGALKMAIDGGLTSKTAWKSWPYRDEDEAKEVELRLDPTKLEGWVKEAHDAGWSVGIHVMGDTAIEAAVNAMYKAYEENPSERRHQLIHAYYPTDDTLDKMKKAGIIAAVQPAFIYNEADGYDTLLPDDKQVEFLPLRKYIDSGITIASSTDMPSAHYNPFWGIYGAIERKGIQGYSLGKDEAITLDEMIKSMTLNGAYMSGEEDIKGSIEPGKLADIIVLDRNIANEDIDTIKNSVVVLTMVDGEIVYKEMQ